MMKKILFVASEGVPFIKTGGLADVVGSLPKCFDKKEYDVRVILPKYACIKEIFKKELKYKLDFYMDMSWRNQYVGVWEIEYEGVHFYFIDNEYYFHVLTPYSDIVNDAEKFVYFSKAALSTLPQIDFKPDVIHCHDWQTGLVPVFLDHFRKNNAFYQGIKTVFTIHNLRFQGIIDKNRARDIISLPEEYFEGKGLEAYGCVNFLKGGVVFADKVTTVSQTYADEIKTSFYGEGLDGLMRQISDKLVGIVNGIDYIEFNPETDRCIEYPFNVNNFLEGKRANKRALQQELHLPEDTSVMMIGIVSRLTDQKGFDLVDHVMDELCQDNIQIVVLGTGEERYEASFRHYADKYPDKVVACMYYSEEMSHKVYASCDAFLMPSLFEPCGLSQLMSLRYGTVPIVRETGGLKDTVEAYNEYEKSGTGFSFANYNAHEMMYTVRYAEQIYYDKKRDWDKIAEQAMRRDFSWTNSAKLYEALYDSLLV